MRLHSSIGALYSEVTRKNLLFSHFGYSFSTSEEFYHKKNSKDNNKEFSSAGGSYSQRDSSAGSSKQQFDSQQKGYHRHSFHEKEKSCGRNKDETLHMGRKATFTGQEKKSLVSRWENAFFARVHFEEGMHKRYAEALKAEEKEKEKDREKWEDEEDTTGGSNEINPTASSSAAKPWFSNWSEDETTPRNLFHAFSAKKKLRFIVERLSKGERRIKFAPDYGGLTMMAQLNLGELMIKDAEKLLLELDWMTPELQDNIEKVKSMASRIKFDYDLD